MLESFRRSIGAYFLRRDVAMVSRMPEMINIDRAKRVGIIYELNGVQDYNHVLEFVSSLQHDKKEVKALGFVTHQNLTERFLPKLSYDFFSSADLNWYYKPVSLRVKNFQREKFDLLIDLSLHDNLSLFYIVALSTARCRVGRFSEQSTAYHDLMIKTQPLSSLRELISQIKHYLTIIHTPG